jgi:hypothetical protein
MAAVAAQWRQAAGKPGDRAAVMAAADQSGGGGGMATVAAAGRQRWMRGGSVGRAAEAAWQLAAQGQRRQRSGSV